jgi:hypothetical protein
MAQFPSPTSADGIWKINEVRNLLRGQNWPLQTIGLTSNNPAISAKQVYTSSGNSVTDGVYYINNIYTGGTTRAVYCRFNKDGGKSFQRWSPAHLTTYGGPRIYYSNGTSPSLTVGTTIDTDASTTSTGIVYNSGASTSAGASAMVDTGKQLSDFQGHTWIEYVYINNSADGLAQNKSVHLDFGSSSGTANGNYGSQYVPDYYWVTHNVDGFSQAGAGSSALSKVTFVASSTNTLVGASRQVGGTSYSTLWAEASDFTTNGGAGASQQVVASNQYVGLRFSGWSDVGSASVYYTSFWAHID